MDRTVSSFLQHLLVEKGFSQNTCSAYRNDLSQFVEFLQLKGIGKIGGKRVGHL